ncbi:hypothetical protein ABB37_02914 [Leptomonas pyrrhocoris]|uniref:BILBO1 N-terminal domain-containing protein n=1 Tax=Leptomonas pyrrhocoris TaxID=157538 RepID=A0A0N0VGD2_LEPPY|nr:hypothetical protein ABB37_02914 [Leptomonas pyrrhocoris]KPA83234.1 hypothetical protein ABB37_02914 [Leptomonas pyrrhocoris]|eukprot:XP_015661673.1 hypothetical protein ABB37_02914 [Leptomonas pyrrhocoris]
MEFPVYVAADCHGEKINVAVRYNPRTETLVHLFANAETAFALFTMQYAHEEPLQPFAFAYAYSDVQCQWNLLEGRDQLSPCCQVYVFRCGGQESVDAIPEPINLVLRRPESVSRRGSSPRVGLASSVSPPRLFSDRWVLPREEQGGHNGKVEDVEASPAAAVAATAPFPINANEGQRRSGGRQVHEVKYAPSTYASGVRHSFLSAPARTAAAEAASFGAVQSHRFRLQLVSPPIDSAIRISKGEPAFHIAVRNSTHPPSLAYNEENPGSYSSAADPAVLTTAASSTRGETAGIPPAWYNPASAVVLSTPVVSSSSTRHRYLSPGPTTPSSVGQYRSSTHYGRDHHYAPWPSHSPVANSTSAHSWRSPFPQVVLSAPPPPPPPTPPTSPQKRLGPPPLHPPSYSNHNRYRRGSSILREERDRVEERMHMSMEDLRASLQAEDRGYERSRSSSQNYRK